jgi:uncharacterized protein YkwD
MARNLPTPSGGGPRVPGSGRLLAIVLALCVAAPIAATPALAADPAFTPDGAAAELARLLNGERAAQGLPALAIDPFLALKARDGAVACPDGSGTVEGRAKDMASSGYFSHSLRLCPTYSALDAMAGWGYTAARGEIIAMNSGYGYGAQGYTYGCDVGGSGCGGGSTTAPATVGVAAHGFMTSQGHRDIVLSPAYDRFACGAWQVDWVSQPGSYTRYYACMFSFGPGAATPPPTPDRTAPAVSTRISRSGSTWTFRATFRDSGGLATAVVYVDGRRLSHWTLGGARSASRSARKRTWTMPRGWHTVAWKVTDKAGNQRVVRKRFWNRGW